MAESEMVVRRLIQTPERIHSLLLSDSKYERLQEACAALPDRISVMVAPLSVMEAIAGFHIHRGVLAAGWRPIEQDLVPARLHERIPAEGPCTILLACGINNADNMGGLFRTAAGLRVHEVVLDGGCSDPLYRKAVRVSMGHVLSVPWTIADDVPSLLEQLKSDGFRIVAAETGPLAAPLRGAAPMQRKVVVVGSEGHGLDQHVLDAVDEVLEIPMAEGVPSLNVVVAAGIVLSALAEE